MHRYPLQTMILSLCVVLAVAATRMAIGAPADADFYVLPFDVDPPIVVDADLGDWSDVPNALVLDGGETCVFYNEKTWQGPADLSARIRLAWRRNGLFLAAEVTDDVVFQPLTGPALFRGDHVVLWLDMIPGEDPQRTRFGKGQCQLGLSPGNFADIAPTIHVWRPDDATQEGGDIASRPSADGYVIEAFIPFERLQIRGVEMNTDANIAVGVSDCDQTQPVQETMLVRGQGIWRNSRDNLLPMVFGDGNGQGTMPPRTVTIADQSTVQARNTARYTFAAEDLPEGKAGYLFLQGRVNAKTVAGYANRVTKLTLNGHELGPDRLSNKPAQGLMVRGTPIHFVRQNNTLTLPYAPRFDREINWHPHYGPIDHVPAEDFEFHVSDLLNEGDNELVVENLADPREDNPMTVHLAELSLRIRSIPEPAPPPRPAPTGPLPTVEPQQTFPKTYTDSRLQDGALTLKVGEESVRLEARFTTPNGQWNAASTPMVDLTVRKTDRNESVLLEYVFTNKTDRWLPIMQEYTCETASSPREIWLAGLKIDGDTGRAVVEANPSAVAVTAQAAVALVALNDVFRVHISQFARDGRIGLADRDFVLAPGGTYTAELAVVPTPQPDFYAALNACRRMLEVNFTIEHLFAFLGQDAAGRARGPWTDDMLENFVLNKSADLLSTSVRFKHQGRRPHGTAFRLPQYAPYHDQYVTFHQRLRELFPGIKIQVYYHSYLDVTDEGPERFADCRALSADGEHMDYSKKGYWLYTPTLTNAWGQATAPTVDFIFDRLQADGVYWDEFNRSRAKYVYNMLDEVSADIDPETFRLQRRKGAVALLSREFNVAMAKKIMARGPLVTNGAPHTRTLAALKYQCFTETGSLDNCRRVLLYTPVALGDHLTEHSEADAYRVMMGALDRGCLYSWYSSTVIPTYKTITEHMFPFTPIELHEGYVIGQERILTNRSGIFGWGDASDMDVHFYDETGRPTDGLTAEKVQRNGKAYVEIRLPEGCSAAIVRKQE